MERFAQVCQIEPGFTERWQRQPRNQTDQAECEYGLATTLVLHEWPDQETTNVLIAHRRKNGLDPKPPEYYLRIIARARAASPGRGDAADSIPLVDQASAKLALDHERRIIQMNRYTCEPARYEVVLAHCTVMLGGIAGLADWSKFYHSLLDGAGISIPSLKKSEWAATVIL